MEKKLISQLGREVFEIQIETLNLIKDNIEHKFEELIEILLENKGRIIVTGLGKSGHISNKVAATLSSLGIPAYYLHPTEALHGDLGRVKKEDIVIFFSNSGETSELLDLIPSLKLIGSKLIAIVGREQTSLGKISDFEYVLPIIKEASLNNLAPTTSTTAQLLFGDAIAVVLSKVNSFTAEQFAIFHPKGALGKKLSILVEEIMIAGDTSIKSNSNLKEAILKMSTQGLNGINIIDDSRHVVGILTDGDLRRLLNNSNSSQDIYNISISEVMRKEPLVIYQKDLAVKALEIMKNRKEKPIIFLPVVNDENKEVGVIRIHDIMKEGIIL